MLNIDDVLAHAHANRLRMNPDGFLNRGIRCWEINEQYLYNLFLYS